MTHTVEIHGNTHRFADPERAADCLQQWQYGLNNGEYTVVVNGKICADLAQAFYALEQVQS